MFNITVHKRKIFHLFLAMIYTAFFAVQLFFNFDTSGWQKQPLNEQAVVSYSQSSPSKSNSFSKKHTEGNDSKPRLNKRFQPKSIEFIPTVIQHSAFDYIDDDQKYSSFQSILLVSFIRHYSLRGPPVVTLSV